LQEFRFVYKEDTINPQHNRGSSRGKPKEVTSDGTVKVVISAMYLVEKSPSRITTCSPKAREEL